MAMPKVLSHTFLSRFWRRIAVLLVFTGLVLAVWTGHELLLRRVTDSWIVSDPMTGADVIVVLGGDFEMRPRWAADLYRTGIAKRILVSQVSERRRNITTTQPSHTELIFITLLRLGVPFEALETFG